MYNAIIVGGRVAGATTALLLAERGYQVLLLDRDRFPSPVLSTHVFFTDCLDVFERMGVLDEVLAIDAPRLTRMRFPYVEADFPEVNGRDFALCIRRETLDVIPLRACERHPNIEVHTETRVTELVWDDERVVGVQCRARGSVETFEARAKIVIGADSRHSLVAREVRAEAYDEVPALFAWYYGYFKDVPLDDPPSVYAARTSLPEVNAEYAAAFVFPCEDNLTLVGFGVQRDRFDAFREDHRGNYFAGLRTLPQVMERLGDAELVGPIIGTGDLPNFLRMPFGPGWALVGDAGCHKDPHTIQGMGDAARSAVMLADELDAWWSGDKSESDAGQDYHRRRDADLRPMYDFTTNRLQGQVDEEVWEAFGELTWQDPELARARVAATAHAIDPATVYSPEAVIERANLSHGKISRCRSK
jgi:flavin-dependent dehydrogenase